MEIVFEIISSPMQSSQGLWQQCYWPVTYSLDCAERNVIVYGERMGQFVFLETT